MKKTLSFMVMAFALLFAQCRKPEVKFPTPSAADEGTTVSMTVTAGPGSKTDITTAGGITWSTGDKLYVGDGAKYIGCLTLQGAGGSATGTFSGDVMLPAGTTDEKTFHFFYLGSGDYTSLMKGSSTSVVVDFSSQNIYADVNNKADVNKKLVNASAQHVGYGSANGTVTNGVVTGINVTMVSKVALARFSFTEAAGKGEYTGPLTLSGTGIYNKMTVNFNSAGFACEGTKGGITLEAGHAERYVMLVPTTSTTGSQTLNFVGGDMTGSTKLESGIEANKFYRMPDGSAIPVTVKPKPKFTVGTDDSGNPITVEFSPGNLQYLGNSDGTGTWRFAEHQWDYMGDGPESGTTKQGNVDLSSLDYSVGMYNTGSGKAGGSETNDDKKAARDLFGWGATGYQDTRTSATGYQTNYRPYSTSNKAATSGTDAYNKNRYGYGPDFDETNEYGLSVENKSDWGCLAIGTDPAGTWRTLTMDEWVCLLNTRTTTTTELPESSRYAKVTVNGVSGMLLFPDSFAWTSAMGTAPTVTNTSNAAFTHRSYTADEFAEQEQAGVVFLPAAGNRFGGVSTMSVLPATIGQVRAAAPAKRTS